MTPISAHSPTFLTDHPARSYGRDASSADHDDVAGISELAINFLLRSDFLFRILTQMCFYSINHKDYFKNICMVLYSCIHVRVYGTIY